MTRTGLVCVLLGSLPPLSPVALAGQSISVQVLAAESRESIQGAFVSLMTEGGDPIARALTNPRGRAIFSVSQSGTYQLKAEMLGRSTGWSPRLNVLLNSPVSFLFELEIEPIPLTRLVVEAKPRCRIRPQEGQEMARVWDEAQKALSIQAWMGEMRTQRFQILSWERDLDREGTSVVSETSRSLLSSDPNPIKSLPVDQLISGGFVQRPREGEVEYFGPDASALLSNQFLNTHCFRLAEKGGKPDLIGLAFEPTNENRSEIAGTFWLERETGHLRLLEFEYENLPNILDAGVARGRVEFDRLADGGWVVRKWWIQVPIIKQSVVDGVFRLVGIREAGQEIVAIRPLPVGASLTPLRPRADSVFPRPPTSRTGRVLVGTVVEEGTGDPISEVDVHISDGSGGRRASTRTDGLGRFSLRIPTPGPHLLRAHRLGYLDSEQEISASGRTGFSRVTVRLHPEPIPMEGFTVTAERERMERKLTESGFYHRRELGFGHFIGPRELENRVPMTSRDLLRGIPGITVLDNGFAGQSIRCPRSAPARDPYRQRSPSGVGVGERHSVAPLVYLDGVLMSFPDLAATPGPDVDLKVLGLESIAGIEVFTRATQVPLQFSSYTASCVILIWTKGGQ